MSAFSYSAAYLDASSVAFLNAAGLDKDRFHLTTCFDNSGRLKPEDAADVQVSGLWGIIAKISEWRTGSGRILVAEMRDCDWSATINAHLRAAGAKEDVPHRPHVTLRKPCQPGDAAKYQPLVGCMLSFGWHQVTTKSRGAK